MENDRKPTRLESEFAAAGRSPDDVLRVRDLIEYDNAHHCEHDAEPADGETPAPKKTARRRK